MDRTVEPRPAHKPRLLRWVVLVILVFTVLLGYSRFRGWLSGSLVNASPPRVPLEYFPETDIFPPSQSVLPLNPRIRFFRSLPNDTVGPLALVSSTETVSLHQIQRIRIGSWEGTVYRPSSALLPNTTYGLFRTSVKPPESMATWRTGFQEEPGPQPPCTSFRAVALVAASAYDAPSLLAFIPNCPSAWGAWVEIQSLSSKTMRRILLTFPHRSAWYTWLTDFKQVDKHGRPRSDFRIGETYRVTVIPIGAPGEGPPSETTFTIPKPSRLKLWWDDTTDSLRDWLVRHGFHG